jgi:hypothetical protein
MEMMDLVIEPSAQRLMINPSNPYISGALAK